MEFLRFLFYFLMKLQQQTAQRTIQGFPAIREMSGKGLVQDTLNVVKGQK